MVSTLRELLVMPCKIVRQPSSNPAYLAILVPEAINPGRGISYNIQNRVPSYQLSCVPGDTYPAILILEVTNLGEPLAMPGNHVHTRRTSYPAILVPEAINYGRAITYTRQNRMPT